MNYKYNIGDRVRVLDGSNINDYLGGWTSGMLQYVNDEYTVTEQICFDDKVGYKLNESDPEFLRYTFDERGLELADNTTKSEDSDTITIKRGDIVRTIFDLKETEEKLKKDPMLFMLVSMIAVLIEARLFDEKKHV